MQHSVLIIDDEPIARRGIQLLLKKFPQLKVIGECSDGQEAVKKITELSPELIFLDIQMPELNGFETLQKIPADKLPVIIFTTAFDEYALEAFKVHALDYLLKPVKEDDFRIAVERALLLLENNNDQNLNEKLLEIINKNNDSYLTHYSIKTKGKIKIINVDEILWISAEGDYVGINTSSNKYLERDTLSSLHHKLDPKLFVRIHRSTIVNLKFIKELESLGNGDYVIFLKSGQKLNLSRNYKDNLFSLI